MKAPFVSIIIPNLNNQKRLGQCLAALQKQTYPQEQVEIIVVDNGSCDLSVEISKNYPVQLLIKSEYKSPYWCRNAGIKISKGKIIALLDSNCIPSVNWLESGIQCLAVTTASIVTGPVRFQFSEPPTLAERIDYLYSVFHAEDIPSRIALPATHLFIKKKLFDEIGLFIPNIRSLGDIEWTQRAKNKGYSFGFSDNAIVDYPAKKIKKAIGKMVRLGGGEKELWASKGQTFFGLRWLWRIVKNFLPPSPDFYRYMNQKNKKEQTHIPPIPLYLGLYLIKLCYAWGMIFKKLPRPLPNPDYSRFPVNNDDN